MNSGIIAKLIILAGILLLLPLAQVSAATFDNIDTHAKLVTAINTANGNSEADTINITANITLAADLPNITTAMTFNGNFKTLDGANSHRAFNITVGGYSMTINELVLTKMQSPPASAGQASGGAIRSSPGSGGRVNLTLNRVRISDSSAWWASAVRNSGGMAVVWTNLTINESIFEGNRAVQGGAIQIAGNTTTTINRSAFRNNVSRDEGGAIRLFGGTLTINNSSFYNNTAENTVAAEPAYGGAIQVDDGGTLDLNHVTITGNTVKNATSNRGGGLANILVSSTTTVRVRNSIIYGNSPEDCYQTIALSVNTGNIIGGGNCGAGTTGSSADPQLAGPFNSWYIPRAGSPAIDAVDCLTASVTASYNIDQRGVTRPIGSKCDRGAIEHAGYVPPPPPAPPGSDVGGPGGGSASSRSGSQAEAMPTAVPVIRYSPEQSCQTLQPDIVVSNASSGTSCSRVEGSEIGHPDVIAAMPSLVVDLWGWVTPGTQVCFLADSGAIKFIDTTAIPRTVADLPVFSEPGGLLCATIDGAGQVALVPGPSAPAPQQQAASAQGTMLSGCMVTLQYSLNFRDAPDGEKIGALRSQIKLTALERADGWFKVDYHGERGWISAAYVEPEGDCG